MHAGKSFYGEAIQKLAGMALAPGPRKASRGRVEDLSVFEDYVSGLARDHGVESGLRVAWDCGNGATGEVVANLVVKI